MMKSKVHRLRGSLVAGSALVAAFGLAAVATNLDSPDPDDRAITLTATWAPSMSKSVKPTPIHWEVGPAGAARTEGDELVPTPGNHWQRVVHAKRGERVALFPAPTEGRTPACSIFAGHNLLTSGTTSCVVLAVP